MAFVLHKHGDATGFDLVAKFLSSAHSLEEWEKHPEFSMISYFETLSTESKERLKSSLEQQGILERISDALGPFLRVFESNNPLRFLSRDEHLDLTDEDIQLAGQLLADTMDRWSMRGTILQSLVVHYSFNVGKTTIPQGMDLP
jgi:hypothetical protein